MRGTSSPAKWTNWWSQRFNGLAERDAKQSEDADRRQQRDESHHPRHLMCIVFVRSVHEYEACGACRAIGSEHADAETRDRFPGEHHWSDDAAMPQEFGQLVCNAARGPR
jgi:hypothetical protein